MKMEELPRSDGVYWYEYADYPVVVKRLDNAHGNKLCAFIRDWVPIEYLREGWWSGPLVKPNASGQGQLPQGKVG